MDKFIKMIRDAGYEPADIEVYEAVTVKKKEEKKKEEKSMDEDQLARIVGAAIAENTKQLTAAGLVKPAGAVTQGGVRSAATPGSERR